MKKFSIAIILSILACINAYAITITIDGVYYKASTHYGVSGYDVAGFDKTFRNTTEILDIPEEITVDGKEYPVIGIATIFNFPNLKKLVLPKSIIYLMPKSIMVGSHLTEFEFNCKNISSDNLDIEQTYIDCPGVNTPIYSDTYFFQMPRNYKGEYAIPEGIRKIGSFAFVESWDITKITLPSTLEEIGYTAFFSHLEELDIPESVKVLPDVLILYHDKVKTVVGNSKFLVAVPADYEGEFVVPEGVEYIRDAAFYNCKKLTSVKLPSTLKEIGNNAFEGCTNLTAITLPENLDYLGYAVFKDCGIKQISIPATVRLLTENSVPIICWGIADGVEVTLNWPGKPLYKYCTYPGTSDDKPYDGSEFHSTVYIPAGTLEAYKSTYGFNCFVNVVELNPTAIDSITAPKNKYNTIYNINGQRLNGMSRGINIINGKKVIIK